MSLLSELEELGVDTEAAIGRLGGDEEIFVDIVAEFPEDSANYDVASCFDSDDFEAACQNAHAMKGAAGNLGLTPLFEMYKQVNDLLKEGKNEEARSVFQEGYPMQKAIFECIIRNTQ